MKNQHTPGPWENHYGEVTTPQINGRSFRRIAAVQDYGLGGLPEVDEANANLIAAAPDLLSALIALEKASRKVLDTSATHDGLENCKTLLEARIAIQKARGEV